MKTSTDISEPEWRPREKTYPKVIVLNVTFYLTNTGLFDDQHQNVVIVVTKALIFWSDYE
jgi:hypothetical protein